MHEADALLSGNDFAGLGVHEAARIAAHADGGCILASAATVAACGASAIAPPREVAFKGLSDRVAVQDILWSDATRGRDMTEAYELRNMVEDEQAEFAELLRGLTPEQWETPSLCDGWSIHDAVIHIAMARARRRRCSASPSWPRVRFSEDRQMEPDTGPPDGRARRLAGVAGDGRRAPGHPHAALRARDPPTGRAPARSGIDRKIPADRLGGRARLRGLRGRR